MIPVYICEDNERELQAITKMINDTINQNKLQDSVEIVCAVQDPLEVLDRVKNDMQSGIYFLDVDLGIGSMNGIELGANIRILDPGAYIVMVTTHAEAAPLTYKYKIGAKDYILKDTPEDVSWRVRECIIQAHETLTKTVIEESKIILVRKDGEPFTMYANQIHFIEVAQDKKRRLRIHENYIQTEVISTLGEMLSQLDKDFCQCHKSYVVNFNHVKAIDRKQRIVYMENGHQVPISVRVSVDLEKRYLDFLIR